VHRIRLVIEGLLGLLRLGLSTQFRRGGAYWRWREETAFGADRARWPSAAERWHAMLEYAAWARRMRRHLR
jgi:hypothetical protein